MLHLALHFELLMLDAVLIVFFLFVLISFSYLTFHKFWSRGFTALFFVSHSYPLFLSLSG
jgi:hypothetical protein